MSLEMVRWRDAHFETDEPDEWPDDFVATTVGWVEDQPLFLRIVGEHTPNGDRAITRIPHEMVLERIPLEHLSLTKLPR